MRMMWGCVRKLRKCAGKSMLCGIEGNAKEKVQLFQLNLALGDAVNIL